MDGDNFIPQGAEAVGPIDDASGVERVYVRALRRWLEDASGRDAVLSGFAAGLGARDGLLATALMEAHLQALARWRARPLFRHGVRCPCLGRDEAALGRIVARAGTGDLEGAYEAAAGMLRPEGLIEAIETAARLGSFLALMARPLDGLADAFDAAETGAEPGAPERILH